MNALRTCGIVMASLSLVGVAESQGRTKSYNLTVSLSGPGAVTSNLPGIDCGSLCSAKFNSGTEVILTATPDSGATFLGWGGACAGAETSPTCSLTIIGNTNVSAAFQGGGGTPTPYTPTVINVTCDGTGTKLQDALNSLNPVANVYEVRVSGVCPEELEVTRFANLKIIAADIATPPTVGSVTVYDFSNVKLENLVINAGGIFAFGNSSIDAYSLRFICVTCEFAASATDSSLRLYRLDTSSLIGKGTVSAQRGARVLIDMDSTGAGGCSNLGLAKARFGGILVLNESEECRIENFYTVDGGMAWWYYQYW